MKTLRHLFTALLLLCSTVVTAHDFEVDGIYYNILSEWDKTVEVTYKGTSFLDYSNEYVGSVVIPATVFKSTGTGTAVLKTFDAWTSANKSDESTSQTSYTLSVEAGNVLKFDWSVSSESNYDWLVITLDGTEIVKKSGVLSGSYEKMFDTSGSHTLVVKYTKDSSKSENNDEGKIYNVTLSEAEGTIYNVTSIGYCAFDGCTGLTDVVIPDAVTGIGWDAFYGCSKLANISIPKSVVRVGDSAFYGTAWLNNQADGVVYVGKVLYTYKGTMPSNTRITVASGTVSISDLAFWGKANLRYLTIPSSVTSIGRDAFHLTGWLDSQADGVVYAGNVLYTYKGNMPANTSIVVKDLVYGIAGGAFQDCTNLVSIDLKSVTNIGDDAFNGCTRLASVTMSKVVEIGFQAFQDCASLTYITLSDRLRTIDVGGFRHCTGLTSINIPNSVKSIEGGAFAGCTGLTSVRIGYGVTNISDGAFYNCPALKTVYNNSQLNIVRGSSTYGNVAYYASEVIEHEDYTFTTANGVTTLTKYHGTQGNLILPQYYKGQAYVIGDGAFRYKDNLYSVTIPNTVTGIGNEAFYGCPSLGSVKIGNGVTYIGDNAFTYCESLHSLEIGNGVTSIGDHAFRDCSCLTSIEIPGCVTSIGDFAFSSCTGLTSITSHIPARNLFGIDSYVFYDVNKSTCTLYVPYGAKKTYAARWGWNAFTNIVEMEPVNLPGDINADGEVNVGDFAALVNIIFNSEDIDETTKSISDINADGEVNVGDFAALVNLIFNSGSQAASRE